MTAPNPATTVASYDGRTRFAHAETVAVRRPRLLRGLLDTATHVAESLAERDISLPPMPVQAPR